MSVPGVAGCEPRGRRSILRTKRREALEELKHWTWAAQRECRRFRASYLEEYGSAAIGTTINGPDRIHSNTSADIHVLCEVVLKAVAARDRIDRKSPLPAFDGSLVQLIRLLREVHERWDSTRTVHYSPAPGTLRGIPRAARAFIKAFPNRDPFLLTLKNGGPVIADLLDLNDLSSQLFAIERALTPIAPEPAP